MHRFFGRAVMAGGALLIAATAQAQSVGKSYKFGGDLGASMPLGDFGDAANAGYHIGGLFARGLIALPFETSRTFCGLRGALSTIG